MTADNLLKSFNRGDIILISNQKNDGLPDKCRLLKPTVRSWGSETAIPSVVLMKLLTRWEQRSDVWRIALPSFSELTLLSYILEPVLSQVLGPIAIVREDDPQPGQLSLESTPQRLRITAEHFPKTLIISERSDVSSDTPELLILTPVNGGYELREIIAKAIWHLTDDCFGVYPELQEKPGETQPVLDLVIYGTMFGQHLSSDQYLLFPVINDGFTRNTQVQTGLNSDHPHPVDESPITFRDWIFNEIIQVIPMVVGEQMSIRCNTRLTPGLIEYRLSCHQDILATIYCYRENLEAIYSDLPPSYPNFATGAPIWAKQIRLFGYNLELWLDPCIGHINEWFSDEEKGE